MISLNLTPPVQPAGELALVASLLELLSDPKTYKARIAELTKLTDERREATQAANEAILRLQSETEKAEKKLAAERKALADETSRLRTQLEVAADAQRVRAEANDAREVALAAREKELDGREAAIAGRETRFREAASSVGV